MHSLYDIVSVLNGGNITAFASWKGKFRVGALCAYVTSE